MMYYVLLESYSSSFLRPVLTRERRVRAQDRLFPCRQQYCIRFWLALWAHLVDFGKVDFFRYGLLLESLQVVQQLHQKVRRWLVCRLRRRLVWSPCPIFFFFRSFVEWSRDLKTWKCNTDFAIAKWVVPCAIEVSKNIDLVDVEGLSFIYLNNEEIFVI